MKNGGKRIGSGRPKGSLNKKTVIDTEARSIVVEHFLKKWEPM